MVDGVYSLFLADLAVGFIYTFSVTSVNEVQGFYAITPPHVRVLVLLCLRVLLNIWVAMLALGVC